MKETLNLFTLALLLFFTSCSKVVSDFSVDREPKDSGAGESVSVNSFHVENNQLVFSGSNLDKVSAVEGSGSNMTGYTFSVVSQSSVSLILNALHDLGTALSMSADTVFSFIISSAQAQTVVNVTVSSGIPSGAIMAFNGSCPTGWSAMDGSGSLPDARGRTIIGAGQGPGLADRVLGDAGGTESETLTIANLPSHTHDVDIAIPASSSTGDTPSANGGTLASIQSGMSTLNNFSTGAGDVALAAFTETTTSSGGSASHNNMQPFLAATYCIKD